jgi:exodeoxyribonuclease-3
MTGLGFELCDFHGRFIQADFDKVSVASMSIPPGLKSPEDQARKEEYLELFMGHLKKTLRKRRDFIFAGTFHIAHKPIDLSNWYANQSVSGFLPQEREWMEEVLDEMGFVDAFRRANKAEPGISTREHAWITRSRLQTCETASRQRVSTVTSSSRSTHRSSSITTSVNARVLR